MNHSINLGAGSLPTNIALKNLIQVNHSYKHGFIQPSAETLKKDIEYLELKRLGKRLEEKTWSTWS